MELTMYQVDAFASSLFSGNPAAIIPLESWLSDELLQDIATENNLSETAYFVPEGGDYRIRWFTPSREVELCGHATLAAAHVIFYCLENKSELLHFNSLGGALSVSKTDDQLQLDFPVEQPVPGKVEEQVFEALGARPREVWDARYRMLVFDDEGDIRRINPNYFALGRASKRSIIVTAPGEQADFVCRFFAPGMGINEDPVTGSAYTILTPYWAHRLGRSSLVGRQISPRGGEVACRLEGERVYLAGSSVLFFKGTIYI